MYTRCPTCSTCFRVTDRHLAIANGKVRCGKCQLVFNALEHAIDDLPTTKPTVNTPVSTPAAKAITKKPEPPAQTKKVAPLAPTAKEKSVQASIKEPKAEVSKPKATLVTPLDKKKPAEPVKPHFDSDATMIADISSLDKNSLDNINLDAPLSPAKDITDDEDDSVFDRDFDLNSAIDELFTEETTEEIPKPIKEIETSLPEKINIEKEIPVENNTGDVFTTDAYDATSAESVADILDDMKGQLSLDITEPSEPDNHNYNNEFDFIEFEDEPEIKQETETSDQAETNEETLKKHFNFDEYDLENADDEQSSQSQELKNKIETETTNEYESDVDEDELFNEIDISDFQDSDIEEEIEISSTFLNESHNNSNLKKEDVPFQLRNDIESLQATSKRRLHPLLSASFILILFVLSVAQLSYFRAHDLVTLIPASRPLLASLCEKVDCLYSGPTDTKKIQLISRDVRLHSKEKNALLITAAMINDAYFDQPYPNIHVRLSDISGNIIAERIFNPKTYMGKLSNPFLLMKSKTPVHINFEVVDPGRDAVNFEFTFL